MIDWWLLGLLIAFTLFAITLIVYPLKRRFLASLVLAPIIFIMVFTGYYYWGGFGQWQKYLQHEKRQVQAEALLKSIKSPQELIDKLKAKLDDTPKSAQGWYLLGRLYSGQKEQKLATAAFAKAYRFDPDNELYVVNYAHCLWQLENQQFTDQITGLFRDLLTKNPNQPDALAMLAMNAFASHAYEDAINFWQRLLKLAPPQSEEADAIRKAIAKAEAKIKLRQKSEGLN